MPLFEKYAEYYDLLYNDKDYQKESKFFHDLLQRHCKKRINSVLSIGCGTARYERELSQIDKNLSVTGIDISSDMVRIANSRRETSLLNFLIADARNFKLGKLFDAALSLFHVMSYQNSNQDVISVLRSIHNHLPPSGIFVFDCWYGPGVLTDLPYSRLRTISDEKLIVKRNATPELFPEKNLVKVKYEVNVFDKSTGEDSNFVERHNMRYFFLPEIELFAEKTGFKLVKALPFLSETKTTLGLNDWYAVFILERK